MEFQEGRASNTVFLLLLFFQYKNHALNLDMYLVFLSVNRMGFFKLLFSIIVTGKFDFLIKSKSLSKVYICDNEFT